MAQLAQEVIAHSLYRFFASGLPWLRLGKHRSLGNDNGSFCFPHTIVVYYISAPFWMHAEFYNSGFLSFL